jgi:renalase
VDAPADPVVAVVGAGISGAACARALSEAGVQVRVLDRGRAPGGRMVSRTISGRPVDLGASYFTAREAAFVAVVDDWTARGLARPWTDGFHLATPAGLGDRTSGPLRYGAPRGLRSLVADLLSGLDVVADRTVRRVGPARTGDGTVVDGEAYDAVVLALPDPQAEPLLDPALAAELAAVRERTWEPVLAVAAGWEARGWGDLDGCFVEGSPELAFVADDGRRRGDGAPVLVAHSTPEHAAQHLADPTAGGPALVAATSHVLGISDPPSWTHVQRWTYARPSVPREMPFHLGDARIGLCGDGWGPPRVETAWSSGTQLGRELARRLLGLP